MKQPIKPKTMTTCSGTLPLHHYIITIKKYRKYKRYIFAIFMVYPCH